MLEIIGIYAAIAGGTENAVAQIDIPQDGVIRAIDWDGGANLDADSESFSAELSFIATNQLVANDTRGRISSISAVFAVVTSGGALAALQKHVGPFELAVSGGERIYMHFVSSAGVLGSVRINLHFDGGATVTRRSARR